MTHRIDFRLYVFTLLGKPESKFYVPTQVFSPPVRTWAETLNLDSDLPRRMKTYYIKSILCVMCKVTNENEKEKLTKLLF